MRTIWRNRPGLWIGVLILAASGLIYIPGLGNPLVFDDRRLIDGSIYGVYGGLGSWASRLFSYGTFVWVDTLFPDVLWVQRAVNLLIHLAVGLALFGFYRELTRYVQGDGSPNRIDGLWVGIVVYLLNPVAVYAVAYLIQRSILLATLFSVLALWAFVRGVGTGHKGWVAGALVLYLLAIASKEHAVMIAAIFLPLYVFVRRPQGRAFAFGASGVATVLVLVAVFLVPRFSNVIGQIFDAISRMHIAQLEALSPGVEDRALGLSIINQMYLFFRYAGLWIFPNVQWMSIDLRPVFPVRYFEFPHVLGVLGYVGLLISSTVLVLRRRDRLGFAALCGLMPLLLFMTEFVAVRPQDPFVLYRSYLWAIGLPGLVWALSRGFSAPVLHGVAVGLAVPLTLLSIERHQTFQSALHVWTDAVQKVDVDASPQAVGRWRPFLNRAIEHLDRGQVLPAERDFLQAVSLGDETGRALAGYGITLQLQGRNTDAAQALAQAHETGFREPGLYYHWGEARAALGEFGGAFEAFESALAIEPDPVAQAQTRLRLGEMALENGDFAFARQTFEALIRAHGEQPRVVAGLGLARLGLGDQREALDLLNWVLARQPVASAYYGRAQIRAAAGDETGAQEDLAEALRLNPNLLRNRELSGSLTPPPGQ